VVEPTADARPPAERSGSADANQLPELGLHTPVFRSGLLFNWFALRQNLLVIPPEGLLVAEVSFDVDHKVHAGRALADFASGEGNQVTSHWLQVEYIAGPPITLTPVAGQGLMHL
jgi:hypothetical protein